MEKSRDFRVRSSPSSVVSAMARLPGTIWAFEGLEDGGERHRRQECVNCSGGMEKAH